MPVTPDPSDKADDTFTAGARVSAAPTDCRTTSRRYGPIRDDEWQWIRDKAPDLRGDRVRALVTALVAAEARADALALFVRGIAAAPCEPWCDRLNDDSPRVGPCPACRATDLLERLP